MKKSILLYIGAAILLMTGCAKVAKDGDPMKGKHTVTLRATIDEPTTRVSVDINETTDSGTFSWQQDDWIVVFTEYEGSPDSPVWAQALDSGESAEFELELQDGQALGQYAIYPAAEKCGIDSEGEIGFNLDESYEYVKYATNMPMLGTISGDGISFKAVGGVLKITINNIPENADWLRFTVDNKMIAGVFLVHEDDGQKIIEAVDFDEELLEDMANSIGFALYDVEPNMDFYIPLPCGTYNKVTFSIFEGGDQVFSKTAQIPGGLTIARNQIVVAPALNVSSTGNYINGHEFVDMGTSVKWATMNVGASSPEESGGFFAWGETSSKNLYTWASYRWCTFKNYYTHPLTKYNIDSDYGTVDDLTILTLENDVAHAKWGDGWRIPTKEEWEELFNSCSWSWTDNYNNTGLSGRIFTSIVPGFEDSSIFLPFAGRCYDEAYTGLESLGVYWSSSLYLDNPYYAWHAYMSSSQARMSYADHDRRYGLSVRPVIE